MVILIAGTANTGKTNLSNKLMEKLNIPYFPIDYLMMGIYRSNNNCGYDPMSDISIINKKIWPITLEMIKTSIENKHSMIFEGFQIMPENINSIPEEYLTEIKTVFLCLSENYINKNYEEINSYRSIIERRTDIDDKETMINKNNKLIAKCKEYNIECKVIIENYEKEIEEIFEIINFPNSIMRNKIDKLKPYS